MTIIETERTYINQIKQIDLEALYSICGNAELMKYVGDGKPLSKEQTQKWIEVSILNYKLKGFGMYGVFSKDNDTLIGYCGLILSSDINDYELIYALDKQYWGKGLATEIANAVVKYGFEKLKLKTIFASIDPANKVSEKILLKIGFLEKFRREDQFGLETIYFNLNQI
jgi:ribosomal-protein-alanine N-acetyltransferase